MEESKKYQIYFIDFRYFGDTNTRDYIVQLQFGYYI